MSRLNSTCYSKPAIQRSSFGAPQTPFDIRDPIFVGRSRFENGSAVAWAQRYGIDDALLEPSRSARGREKVNQIFG